MKTQFLYNITYMEGARFLLKMGQGAWGKTKQNRPSFKEMIVGGKSQLTCTSVVLQWQCQGRGAYPYIYSSLILKLSGSLQIQSSLPSIKTACGSDKYLLSIQLILKGRQCGILITELRVRSRASREIPS